MRRLRGVSAKTEDPMNDFPRQDRCNLATVVPSPTLQKMLIVQSERRKTVLEVRYEFVKLVLIQTFTKNVHLQNELFVFLLQRTARNTLL